MNADEILLAMRGSHNNMQNALVLWRTDILPIYSRPQFLCRFMSLTRYIRFDDGRTRSFRLLEGKAAPIQDIWNFLYENHTKNYRPHESITIDEKIVSISGKN